MPDKATIKQFESLLSEYLDGQLSREQATEFVALLKAEETFTDRLLEQLAMDARLTLFESGVDSAESFISALTATLGAEADGEDFIGRVMAVGQRNQAEPAQLRPARNKLWIAAAAAMMLAVGLVLGLSFRPGSTRNREIDQPTEDGVAVLVHADQVEWMDAGRLQPGDMVSPGRIRIRSGVMELEFYSGARLLVEGPADLDLISAWEVDCKMGRVRGNVPPPARGFSITSPTFDLVDLGTEFGLAIESDGSSRVQVFDGEVEIYPPGAQRSLTAAKTLIGGQSQEWDAAGKPTPQTIATAQFPTFEALRQQRDQARQDQYQRWAEWNEDLRDDPRIAFHYDFESDGSQLIDHGPGAVHGTIVGAEWTSGRWPGKRALEFKRPSDRVCLDLPGSLDSFTLTTWLRPDAKVYRAQGLLTTNEIESERFHWHFNPKGALRLDVLRQLTGKRPVQKRFAFNSPVVLSPRQLGAWCQVCLVYDRESGVAQHWFNGKAVASQAIADDHEPLRIGICNLGNWTTSRELKHHNIRYFVGRIDEFTIWNTALSEDEMRQLYQKYKP